MLLPLTIEPSDPGEVRQAEVFLEVSSTQMITSNTKECVCVCVCVCVRVCVCSHIVQTTGGRLWGCNWGGTGLVYFWSMCCSGPGTNSWACASARASHDVCPRRKDQMQVLIISVGFWPSAWAHTLSNTISAECVCVTVFLSLLLLHHFHLSPSETSITQEKTTECSTLSLCDWLKLLPKQIGLANRSPLNHVSSRRRLRQMKCKAVGVFI